MAFKEQVDFNLTYCEREPPGKGISEKARTTGEAKRADTKEGFTRANFILYKMTL